MMKSLPAVLLLAACIPYRPASSLAGPRPNIVANMPSPATTTSSTTAATSGPSSQSRCSHLTSLRVTGGGEADAADADLRDYSSEMASLFGNIRVPAALFAGASAGAAFALPLGAADGIRIGFVKRVYGLLMMSALSSQLLAIIVSTLAMGSIATSSQSREASSMESYVEQYFDLSWVTARFHFLTGQLCFVVGQGLRAWVTTDCPIFARAALGIITSATLLAVAFVEDTDRKVDNRGISQGLLGLTIKYIRLLIKKIVKEQDVLFAAGAICSLLTYGYVAYNIPHIWVYLDKGVM